MTRRDSFRAVFQLSGAVAVAGALAADAACGSSPGSTPVSAPLPTAAAPPSPTASTAPVVTLLEPTNGTSAGHIDTFTWKAVEGADGYRLDLRAVTDGRSIWQSPVVVTTEVRLPSTVGLEPEGYVWHVSALRGTSVLAVSPEGRFFVTP